MIRTALVLALASGCLMKTSASSAGATTTPSNADDPTAPGNAMDPNRDPFPTQLVRGEIEQLDKLPIEQARAKAKQLGHTGQIEIRTIDHFVQDCADGIVCYATDEREGRSGMGNGDLLLFWVNPKLSIAPPPD